MSGDDVGGAAAASLREARGFDRRADMRVVLRVESRGGRVFVRWPDGREVVVLRPIRLADGVLVARAGRLFWLRGEDAQEAWLRVPPGHRTRAV